ncbi:MAG: hypothetical protein ABIH41_06450 [Nanoarchaeota archaeon]
MTSTTIKIHLDTKKGLDQYREHPHESYDLVIRKMLHLARHARKEPQLNAKTIRAIEAARRRVARGEYYTEEEVRKRLGL